MKRFDLKEHERRIDKLIANRFSASFMSNSKWERFFTALDVDMINIRAMLLKRVGRIDPHVTYMPKKEDLEKIWVSEGYNDCSYFYKEIEWLELINVYKPSNIPSQYVYQNIDDAESIINKIGKFEVERTPGGLRVYGYKT
ncbi:DUF6678 family protein [Pleionea litopenaei]|uniref:Uncharacterized protein n=1 Tax=Pleionea litopenaei TaxID=3070815 RepID=A0AA51RWH2_9GAMM|nr:DUF6678 family protein [Pleionea sp. HL-JVS1]WMS88739.1 hypothetical protein Q9312_07430 [Pleionea sp. HL-JVS1]